MNKIFLKNIARFLTVVVFGYAILRKSVLVYCILSANILLLCILSTFVVIVGKQFKMRSLANASLTAYLVSDFIYGGGIIGSGFLYFIVEVIMRNVH